MAVERLLHIRIRYTHVSIDIPLYVCLVIETQLHYAISKICGAKQNKANVCYDEVSYFVNFSPGFTYMIYNRKHK